MFSSTTDHSHDSAIGKTLGLASLGVALAELAIPRQIEEAMGIGHGEHSGLLRVLGVRELLHGLDLLSHDDPVPGVKARTAGDLLDGALLAIAATKTKNMKGLLAICGLVLPLVAADMYFANRLDH